MGASDDLSPSEVSREHIIFNVDPGLLAIAGGKLTTYRKMAEEAVDRVLEKLGRKGSEACGTRRYRPPTGLAGPGNGGKRCRTAPRTECWMPERPRWTTPRR